MKQGYLAMFARATAWLVVAAIAYATLTHVGFVYTVYFKLAPIMGHADMQTYAHFEHVLAFALFGVMFAAAYPGRIFLVILVVVGGAASLEFMQTLTPDRHGTLSDAVEKMAGGIVGILLARGLMSLLACRKQRSGAKATD
jgi:VanZ family protein